VLWQSSSVWLPSPFSLKNYDPRPNRLDKLTGESTIPVGYVDVGGMKLRYVKAGSGRTLVLLHVRFAGVLWQTRRD